MSAGALTNKPTVDRAEVSLDTDRKLYTGAFGRDSLHHDARHATAGATRRTRRRKKD